MRSPTAPLLALSLLLAFAPACAGDDGTPAPPERERPDRPGHGGADTAPRPTPASDAAGADQGSASGASSSPATTGPPGTGAEATDNPGSTPPDNSAGAGHAGPGSEPGGTSPGPPSDPPPPGPGVDCGGGFGPDFFDIAPDCVFLAHSPSRLFEVDPWRGTVVDIGPTTGSMFDIDTAPDGTVYGVANRALHRYDAATGRWSRVGDLTSPGLNPNGLCINGSGVGFVTSGNQLYQVNLSSGATTAAPNRMGGGFQSSGDCVIDKADIIYMSSSNTSGNDDLVRIDNDGTATLIGRTNHDQIYGLTAAWGRLFGTTGRGEIIDIDWDTGQSRTLHSARGVSFYGAASTASIDR